VFADLSESRLESLEGAGCLERLLGKEVVGTDDDGQGGADDFDDL